ncbi:xanthine dehydrogenase family protein molybdopterin-binding subunit [Siccirubricoccus sp. KC 17139]|uniref:Xanthine dehydrogenase family protein molybdopterin-binding subunit n=1 Tax=Siccirubricoccus soli TaxID=2899147 RepID=A0ABT1DBG0_9PROT|nr:xanthine dehydrogenase family protein molybdopterin-binding subunit [Siccirubricoccus soli]MCO6419271.1 xanthine dehydrogenase family protein molybdopterin-binding subunit [Siccirubricoccus soli]MCP2685406.1 xanthine dehydrogenase family protein molybdopterin-binding subunit [Siccirubricoccus soli]
MPDITLQDITRLKFGVGQPVPRNEDPILLQGQGRYTDDLDLPGQLWCVMVRSPYAHGVIKGIDIAAAKEVPGVVGVFTGADLAEYGPLKCLLPLKNRDGSPLVNIERPSLATDKVRFVGDPVAFVVAESKAAAKDGAEAVFVDIDVLPAVTEASAAAAPDAPLLYDHVPGNQVLDFHFGDAEKVAAAFASAAHVTRLSLRNNRVVVCAMEPRSAIGEYDPATGRYTLHVGSQGVFGLRAQMANDILKVPTDKVRILTGNVGGSFGMKANAYPEYTCLLHAAKVLGRPVKWTDERTGSFLSDQHGRDHEVEAELALDAEGRALAVRLTSYANMGGYLSTVAPLMGTGNFSKNIQSNYATPLIEVTTKCLVTNTTPVSAYRGAGRPEGNYFFERLLEQAAKETGRSAIELRRINHIKPEAFPFSAPSGSIYDSGDFTGVLEAALEAADWDGFAARKAESKAAGKLRGRGIGNFLECTAPPMKEQGEIRFNADGTVTIITGTLDYGQGHWTPFAQVLHQTLGVPFESIRLVQGDSDLLVAGGGTGGSKSLMASGAAIIEAAQKVIEKGRLAAAHMLEAAPADIEFTRDADGTGRFTIAGTDRSMSIMEVAARIRTANNPPPEMPDSLDVKHVFGEAPMAYPNGCHICEVEIDPDTGITQVVRYVSVNDFGVIVNPLLVEGQAHGGIVQGIGQAIYEQVAYSEEGQLLSGSYQDYALPRASDVPSFGFLSRPDPCKTNPIGAKGCGEAGCAGSLPAVMNAIVDALSDYGITHIDMPATPERVWRAIQDAQRA